MAVSEQALNRELKKISLLWKKVKPQSGFGFIDDGSYVAKLVKMKVGVSSGEKKRLQCMSAWKIMDGDFKGKDANRFDGLNEQSLGYFKDYCHTIGLELGNDASEWNSECETFVEENTTLFNIQIRTKNNFQNIFIKGPSEYEEDTGEELGGEALDDDLGEPLSEELGEELGAEGLDDLVTEPEPEEEEDEAALLKKLAQIKKNKLAAKKGKASSRASAKPKGGLRKIG